MWLGHLWDMSKIPCASTQTTNTSPPATITTSITGARRVTYLHNRAKPRTWSISHSALPPEGAALLAGMATLTPSEPYAFLPEGAEKINLLTPRASLLDQVPGFRTRPYTKDSSGISYPGGIHTDQQTVKISSQLPFPFPGETVTISCVGAAGATLSIQWRTANGKNLTRHDVTAPPTAIISERVKRTIKAPADAACYDVLVKGDIAAPCMTLGDQMRPFGVGQAAREVIVQDPSTQLLATWSETVIQSHSFHIMEVGTYA